MKSEISKIKKDLRQVASIEKAQILRRFFKTGQGQYGEGDQFLGIVVPEIRRLVKKYREASREDILTLLHSAFHEERLWALLVLVDQFERGDEKTQKDIFEIYWQNTKFINNWDLVDLTADKIAGAYLKNRDRKILLELAESKILWERRIAILATFHFTKNGECEWTLKIAKKLLGDEQDLIHKAVGWMLREVGKRCSEKVECDFLDQHALKMSRTMLRYAIEKFEEKKRKHYLDLK